MTTYKPASELKHFFSFWVPWNALSFILLVFIAAITSEDPVWMMGREKSLQSIALISGYIIAAVSIQILLLKKGQVEFSAVILATLAGFFVPMLYLIQVDVELARVHILATFAIAFVLLVVPFLVPNHRNRLAALTILAVGLILGVAAIEGTSGAITASSRPNIERFQIPTSLYNLQSKFYRRYFPQTYSGVAGGGIAQFRNGGLLATGDGDFYQFHWKGDALEVAPVGPKIPMNRSALIERVGVTSYVHWFRVFDLETTRTGEGTTILASHHHWNQAEGCFTVRVSSLFVDDGFESLASIPDEWRTLYQSAPCLPLLEESHPGWPFRGMEGGGRMLLLEDRLLLSIGDQGFNGQKFMPNYVEDMSATYGKTVLINLESGDWEVFTTGHRNPQGLAKDMRGRIWLTEHGPQGGDELNLLEPESDFGWPRVTYGTEYGRQAWPFNPNQGRHEEYEKPVYAWVPSIGPSQLLFINSETFPDWNGDLIVASLLGRTLYRIRLSEDSVKLAEPIPIGEPIRDLYVDPEGRLILWTDKYSLITISPSVQSDFARCSGCHKIGNGDDHGLGPDLRGVIGRPIGQVAGYQFSDALRSLDGTWTEEALNEFLLDPNAFVQGTSMQMTGITDTSVRERIINHLIENAR